MSFSYAPVEMVYQFGEDLNTIVRLSDKKHFSLLEPSDELNEYLIWAETNVTAPSGILAESPRLYPCFFGNDKFKFFKEEEVDLILEASLNDIQVKKVYDRFICSVYLTYGDPEVEMGLSLLVYKGLITQERKEEIVSNMS